MPIQRRNIAIVAGAALAGLALGIGVGGGTPATPEPVTVTKTVNVETITIPSECIEALDSAENTIGHLLEIMPLAADGTMAAFEQDIPEVERVTAEVQALTPKIAEDRQAFDIAATTCRDAQ